MRATGVQRREAAARLILLAGSTLAAFACLELWVRHFHAEEVDNQALRRANDSTNIAPITQPSADPVLVYELRPSARVLWNGIKVETDADGMRVSPGRRPTASGAFRLAVLGDSSSFGWRVENDDAYPSRLARLLEPGLGRAVELRNFSVPGYNSPQLLRCLRDRVLPWKPDLVLLHYDHNDADPLDTKPPQYMPAELGDNVLHSALWKFMRRRLRRLQVSTLMAGKETEDAQWRIAHYLRAGPRYEAHLRRLQAMAELGRAAGRPIVVFIFNTFLTRNVAPERDPFYRDLHRPLSERLRGMGLPVIDGYPAAQEWMKARGWQDLRSTWLGPNDPHPNAQGHALIAEYLARRLRQEPALSGVFSSRP